MKTVLDGYEISSDFDSGNLDQIALIGKEDRYGAPCLSFEAKVLPDAFEDYGETAYRSWFYFSFRRLKGSLPGGLALQFTITNINPQGTLFSHDMRPSYRAPPLVPDWRRLPTSSSYEKVEDAVKEGKVTFRFRTEKGQEKLYFAFCFPFSYSDTQRMLKKLERKFSGQKGIEKGVYFERELLTNSLDGRRVDLLTISSPKGLTELNEPAVDGCPHLATSSGGRAKTVDGKRLFFVSARVHPGETPGTHMFNGFLRFILSQDPRARKLRDIFVFKMVPLVNPDGVARGHYRGDSRGVNLNRYYDNPSRDLHPTIFATKKYVVSLHHRGLLSYYIDLHAHASKRGCFAYGNSLDLEQQIDNMTWAKLCSLHCSSFDFDACNFSEGNMKMKDRSGLSKEGSGRVGIYHATSLVHVYTIEVNYNTGKVVNEVVMAEGEAERKRREEKERDRERRDHRRVEKERERLGGTLQLRGYGEEGGEEGEGVGERQGEEKNRKGRHGHTDEDEYEEEEEEENDDDDGSNPFSYFPSHPHATSSSVLASTSPPFTSTSPYIDPLRFPPFNPPKYDIAVFEDCGRAMAEATLDMEGVNPLPRLPFTEYGGLEGVRRAILAKLRTMTAYKGQQLSSEAKENLFGGGGGSETGGRGVGRKLVSKGEAALSRLGQRMEALKLQENERARRLEEQENRRRERLERMQIAKEEKAREKAQRTVLRLERVKERKQQMRQEEEKEKGMNSSRPSSRASSTPFYRQSVAEGGERGEGGGYGRSSFSLRGGEGEEQGGRGNSREGKRAVSAPKKKLKRAVSAKGKPVHSPRRPPSASLQSRMEVKGEKKRVGQSSAELNIRMHDVLKMAEAPPRSPSASPRVKAAVLRRR
uniref:tubulin-glutamate carboxypeptidase n=1 Tax=Palpitomonas bilix TaxID=652834 RepID=A0A7S3GAH4_9EUKA|mmetsp:Transcript_35463/g.92373  ORF Transcript_35463/g.92373 Transcript_35463/m.92373 type:complete len:870 (+) Transcript_35463:231-2840(+)